MHRYDVRNATTAGVALPEDSPGATTVADRDDQLRFRRRVIRSPKRHFHISGDWPSDQQQICVPRTGHEPDAKTFQVVERIAECMHFQLAAVTGACVDGTNAQRATQHRENARLQPCSDTQGFIGGWQRLGGNSRAVNLT